MLNNTDQSTTSGIVNTLSDKQIRKRIFVGAVPIKVTLASNDVTTTREPSPYFALVPRGHYITMLVAKLKDVRLTSTQCQCLHQQCCCIAVLCEFDDDAAAR